MKTALLDLTQEVTIIELSPDHSRAFVMDQDGGEFEVSVDRLDRIEEQELDLSPLERWEKKNKKTLR